MKCLWCQKQITDGIVTFVGSFCNREHETDYLNSLSDAEWQALMHRGCSCHDES
ncbi:MAG: hypothetical protein ACRC5C_00810 [Bacilli bacterium]